jgi:hypothetical protein
MREREREEKKTLAPPQSLSHSTSTAAHLNLTLSFFLRAPSLLLS